MTHRFQDMLNRSEINDLKNQVKIIKESINPEVIELAKQLNAQKEQYEVLFGDTGLRQAYKQLQDLGLQSPETVVLEEGKKTDKEISVTGIKDELTELTILGLKSQIETDRKTIEYLSFAIKELKNKWWINLIYFIAGSMVSIASVYLSKTGLEKKTNPVEIHVTIPSTATSVKDSIIYKTEQ